MDNYYSVQVYNKIFKYYVEYGKFNTLKRARIMSKKSYYFNHGKVRIVQVSSKIVK